MEAAIIGKAFGAEVFAIESWIEKVKPDPTLLQKSIKKLNKRQGFKMVVGKLAPKEYLFSKTELLEYTPNILPECVKGLSEEVFLAHLEQLRNADDIETDRKFPYDSYNAEAFIVFRYSKKNAELKFAKQMFIRSISHHSFPVARLKLRDLANKYHQ